MATSLRRQGPLQRFQEMADAILGSLDTLEEPAAILASRQDASALASVRRIRSTIHRAAMRVYISHSQGIPFARMLLDRIYAAADARDQVASIDPNLLGVLIRRFRSAPRTGLAWRLSLDENHDTAFHAFLSSILSHVTELRQDLFTQIMDIHLDAGTPVSTLTTLIDKCMRLHRFPGRWTPAAYNILILAHRRDGDFQQCLDAYAAFRRSLRPSDQAWDRYTSSTIAWPYESLLAAALDSQRLPLNAGQFRAPQDMPSRIWEDLQADGIPPPPRLIAYLLKGARINGDVKAAHRLWKVFCPDTASSAALQSPASPTLTPSASPAVKLDIDCYLQYLKLLTLPSSAARPPSRKIIRHLLEQRVTASQSPAFVRSLWTQVLRTALSPGYQDFPLAIWVLDRFDTDGLPLDADVIDAIASGILRHALAKPRSARHLRSILGEEHTAHLAAQRKRLPRGVQERNMRSRGITTRDWDLFSHHLASLRCTPGNGQVETVYLPLGRPLARWTIPKQVAARTTTVSDASMDMDKKTDSMDTETVVQLARSLRGLLEACITTPQRGVYSFPTDPSVKHLVPFAIRRKAKPDDAALEPDKHSEPAGHLNTDPRPTDVAQKEPPRDGEEGGDDKKGVTPNEMIQAGERKAREGKAGNASAGDGKVDGKTVLRRAMQEVYRDLFG